MTPLKRTWQRLTGSSRSCRIQSDLQERYGHFQRLLSANNKVLALMTDMEEKLSGDYLFDLQYIRSTVNQLGEETRQLAAALNGLGGGRYADLLTATEEVMAEVQEVLDRRREIFPAPLVIFFEELDAGQADKVGGKNANLGEVRNKLGLPVPAGFAISSYAYKVFLDHNRLTSRITEMLGRWRMDDLDSLGRVSEALKEMIHAAAVPLELEEAITQAYGRLAAAEGSRPFLAIRSSAVGEDLAFTFAGQYATYLNIPPEELVPRYKDIVASLFTARALYYYKNKGFREEEMAMGVAVMPLVCAQASGVLFTRPPEAPQQEAVFVNAVWGLGKYAVAGRVEPDSYLVAYDPPGAVLEQNIPVKPVKLVCRPEGSVTEVEVPPEQAAAPCLTSGHLATLVGWAKRLEEHFQRPQDVEWALDRDGKLWLLQSRLLRLAPPKVAAPRPRVVKDATLLLDRGTVACRGTGAGPVVLVRRDEDLRNFPEGGVLVGRHTSPKYVTVMHQASAIITDAGSPTGHMALLAREFQVPTIINTGNATQVLASGQVVTVDADYGNVYEGLVPELLESVDQFRDDLADTPVFQALKAVVKKIVPLHLVNPADDSFAPAYCQTIHDIVRFAHEYSMREMFRLRDRGLHEQGDAFDLESNLPFKVSMLDLGGGLKSSRRRKVKPDQITSLPFKAFWEGLAAMRWPQAKPAGVESLSSKFVKTEAEIAEGENPYRDQSYVLISANYMNFSIHLGYHFSNMEAYVSDEINDNYLTFHFNGGGSTPERRERRARLIESIIDRLDLQHQRRGDIIEARLAKFTAPEMQRRLVVMGKLTTYTKQLDMVLFSEGIVDWYIKDFVREHIEGKL